MLSLLPSVQSYLLNRVPLGIHLEDFLTIEPSFRHDAGLAAAQSLVFFELFTMFRPVLGHVGKSFRPAFRRGVNSTVVLTSLADDHASVWLLASPGET